MKPKTLISVSLFMLYLISGFTMQDTQAASGIKTDCAINAGPCLKKTGTDNVQIEFDITPKPVNMMSELVFAVVVKQGEQPVTDADITVDLTMPGMFMGINRTVLEHIKAGRYEGEGFLPACPHGGKLWKAAVAVNRQGKVSTVSYLFEVQ
ncbi:MAG: FixH family protein [Nitrospirae bacterium]|nr:FixH family protein [Nitrospirota bacterium]